MAHSFALRGMAINVGRSIAVPSSDARSANPFSRWELRPRQHSCIMQIHVSCRRVSWPSQPTPRDRHRLPSRRRLSAQRKRSALSSAKSTDPTRRTAATRTSPQRCRPARGVYPVPPLPDQHLRRPGLEADLALRFRRAPPSRSQAITMSWRGLIWPETLRQNE